MTLRNVANTFTLDQQRQEINLLAVDVDNLATTFNEQVDDRVSSLLSGGTGISTSYNDVGNSLTLSIDFTEFSTTNITEGTNLYYTQARFDTAFSGKSTTNLSEGTNLYYTQARFDTAFSAKSTTNLSEGTNLYYTQTRFDTAFSGKSTTNLSEGTNLYYTDERVDDRIDSLITAGTGIQKTYDDVGNTYTLALDFTEFSTTNVSEGTNLYYTTTRANTAIDARVTTTFINNLVGVIGDLVGFVSAPATASSSGTAGQFAIDSTFLYVCTATNTWKRAGIATW